MEVFVDSDGHQSTPEHLVGLNFTSYKRTAKCDRRKASLLAWLVTTRQYQAAKSTYFSFNKDLIKLGAQ